MAGGTAAGGSGWSGGWTASTGAGLMVATGRATVADSASGSTRGLANPFSLDSGVLYFGFIAKADTAGAFEFKLKQTGPGPYVRWAFFRNADGSFSIQAGTVSATSAPGVFAAGREYLVVSKFSTSGDVASVKLIDTSDPGDYTTEPQAWDLVADGSTGVIIDALEIKVATGEVSLDEVRLGTRYADVVSERRKTFVFTANQPVTSQPKSWTHTVSEAGDYQIGLASVETISGGNVAVEVFHNSMRVKALFAPPGLVNRFETRLENLKVDDRIIVKATPAGSSYRLDYQIAFGSPAFNGLPVYQVAAYGAVGDGVTDDVAAIQSAVAAATRNGGGTVRFDGTQTYRAIGSTSPSTEYLFLLNGATHIKIEGNGAKILLHPPDALADIDYADNLQIDGLTVDYDPKPYYQGTITNIDMANMTIDITVPDRYPVPLTGPAPTHAPFFGRSFIPDAPGARSGRGMNIYIQSVERNGSDRKLRIQVPATANGAAMAPRVQDAFGNRATELVVPHHVHGGQQRGKASPFDVGVHQPLAMMWPARIKPARTVTDFVNFADFAPTFLEAAGLEIPACMTGRSLLPILGSEKSGRIEPGRDFMVTGLEWHGEFDPVSRSCRSIRDDRYAYVVRYPNIVFIFSDDQPLRAMGRIDPYFSTPNLDRLAKESVVFDNAFVTTSVCAVSRASFFTGQHSVRHGIASLDTPLSSAQMKQSYAGLLHQAGYRTAFLGKYAIGQPRSAPRELCLPEPHGQAGPWNYRDPDFKLDPPPGPPLRPKTMTQAALDRLPKAIRESRNDSGLKAYEKDYETYMARVRDYTARTDLAVGRMLQALQDLNLQDNTVVIFTSDNGSMWGAHGLSRKWNMYEESIRVPLMIRDPRLPVATRGHRSQMVLNIDIAPTILAMAGLPVPAGMQGIDLSPILSDPKVQGRTDWYYEHDVGTESRGKPLPRCEGVRSECWKYIRYMDTQPLQEELFDLEKDPL